MQLNSLSLRQFRNYEDAHVDFAPDCNVICGENAQGKTNLLEAILYLSCAHSPRARSDRELVSFGADAAMLRGEAEAHGRAFRIDISLFASRRRTIAVNQAPCRRAADLSDALRTVYFCPEDLQLLRDGAAARRRFLDSSLSQLRPRYVAALAEYNRLLEHKTRILRDSADYPQLLDTLPEFNLRMAQTGAVLIHYRARYCARLAQCAAVAHRECSGGREELALRYATVSTIDDPFAPLDVLTDALRRHQESHAQAELVSRLCLSGPHKDDIAAEIDGKEARRFSSQGQLRTAALSMKLAERDICGEVTGEAPLLLLDDVLSELDPKRQEYVLSRITGGQVFITCCESDRLGAMPGGKTLFIEKGRVR